MSGQTLTRYLLGLQRETPSPSFAEILGALAEVIKWTSVEIYRAPAADDPRDWTRTLRRRSTQVLRDQLCGIDQLAGLSIAGETQFQACSADESARYLLLADPLHRHVLLHENQPVGFAFSIFDRPGTGEALTESDFLQPGSAQVCAGLALYGPATILVLTTGSGVDGFTLDRDTGDFVQTAAGVQIPVGARMFAINASEAPKWSAPIKRYVDECVQGAEGPRGSDYIMRWNASAVIGVYRTLVRGGVFMVPDTGKSAPSWGVPLLHNAAPLAWVVEQAGGAATTGTQRVLEVVPDSLTCRTPLICGDSAEVNRIRQYHEEPEQDDEAANDFPLFRSRTLFAD